MEYQKLVFKNYNIHKVNVDNFKTITIRINFKRKLKKEEISYYNMLINVLFLSSFKYKNKREIELETENLYGIGYRGTNYQSGIYNVMSFEMQFLSEEYTEEGMNQKSIDFFNELLFNPDVSFKKFNKKSYNLAKKINVDNITSVYENTSLYSQIRLLENMDDSINSYRSCGYLEDLESMNEKKLYDFYQEVIENDIVDIFVIGKIDDKIIEIIKNTFKTLNERTKENEKTRESHFYNNVCMRDDYQEITEEKKVTQSKLILGFKLENLTDFELRYVLNIYNYILGGSPDSKLFKNVREKASLCYTISSSNLPVNGLFLIKAGINNEDYEKALTLILKEVAKMYDGDFEKQDIENGILTYINSLKELQDNPDSILSLIIGHEYLNSDDIDKRILNIKKVTKEDIIKLAKKIKLDTVYFLKGTLNEE